MTANVPGIQSSTPVPAAAARARWWRIPLILLIVVIIFVGTYFLAWWDALRLTNAYVADANASFEAGNYLDALAGYEVFDEDTNEFVRRGGFSDVQRIWRHRFAQPTPGVAAEADARIDEIINERMTIEEAEQFVQENIGRTNPYLGIVYLRLGELYEADGDLRSAEDIYREIEELFPSQTELIERANANLARLGVDE
jgi:tetratricopeptide (TPR) repeat protein